MESKLLDFVKSNGTGTYEGFFKAIIFDKHIIMDEGFAFFVGAKAIVVFSKDEINLGTHLLKVENIDEKGVVSCIIIHNDGDDTPYQPLDGFKDPVFIDLYPWDDTSSDGRFITFFPTGDPKL